MAEKTRQEHWDADGQASVIVSKNGDVKFDGKLTYPHQTPEPLTPDEIAILRDDTDEQG